MAGIQDLITNNNEETYLQKFLKDQRERDLRNERDRANAPKPQYDFSLGPQAEAVLHGHHKTDTSRIDALRNKFDNMLNQVGPLKQPRALDIDSTMAAAKRLGAQYPHVRPKVGGTQAEEMGDIAQRREAQQQQQDDLKPQAPPKKGSALGALADIGIEQAHKFLVKKFERGRKKPKKDAEGNIMRDALGTPIMERKKKGSKLGMMVAESFPKVAHSIKDQISNMFANKQENAKEGDVRREV